MKQWKLWSSVVLHKFWKYIWGSLPWFGISILLCMHNPLIKPKKARSCFCYEFRITQILLDITLEMSTCFPLRMYQMKCVVWKSRIWNMTLKVNVVENECHPNLGLDRYIKFLKENGFPIPPHLIGFHIITYLYEYLIIISVRFSNCLEKGSNIFTWIT